MFSNLDSQLAGWNKNQDTRDSDILRSVEKALEHREHVGPRLAGACGRAAADVAAQQGHRYRGRLDGGGVDKLHLLNGLEQRPREIHRGEGGLLVVDGGVVKELLPLRVGLPFHLDFNPVVCLAWVLCQSFTLPFGVTLFRLNRNSTIDVNSF